MEYDLGETSKLIWEINNVLLPKIKEEMESLRKENARLKAKLKKVNKKWIRNN